MELRINRVRINRSRPVIFVINLVSIFIKCKNYYCLKSIWLIAKTLNKRMSSQARCLVFYLPCYLFLLYRNSCGSIILISLFAVVTYPKSPSLDLIQKIHSIISGNHWCHYKMSQVMVKRSITRGQYSINHNITI